MKRINEMALAFVAAGLLISADAWAQVEVDTGDTKVKVGADGQVEVDTDGAKVKTGAGGVDVKTGETRVRTKRGRASVKKRGRAKVKVGIDGYRGRLKSRGPLICKGNDDMTVKNVTVDGHGPVVKATENCNLVIENCVLRAERTAIVVTDNAEVSLTNCTVHGERAATLTETGTLKVRRSMVRGPLRVGDVADLDKDSASVFRKK